jgi:hypothetical protein
VNLTQLLKRKSAYKTVFDQNREDVRIVLADLRQFVPVEADTNTGTDKNTNKILINVGMQKVLNRILTMTKMSDDKLFDLAMREQAEAVKEISKGNV